MADIRPVKTPIAKPSHRLRLASAPSTPAMAVPEFEASDANRHDDSLVGNIWKGRSRIKIKAGLQDLVSCIRPPPRHRHINLSIKYLTPSPDIFEHSSPKTPSNIFPAAANMKAIAAFSIVSILALSTEALVPARRWEPDPFPNDPKGTGSGRSQLVTQFQVGSAWSCQSLELSYKGHLSEITRKGTCNTFPAGIKSIQVGELDPQCRGMPGVIFTPLEFVPLGVLAPHC